MTEFQKSILKQAKAIKHDLKDQKKIVAMDMLIVAFKNQTMLNKRQKEG